MLQSILFSGTRQPTTRLVILLASILTLVAVTGSAHGQSEHLTPEQEAQAREHFERGLAFHKVGQYSKARKEYLLAYKLSKAPKLLFNLGQVCRLEGDKSTAKRYYELYLAEEPNSDISHIAREQIAEIEAEENTRRREEAKMNTTRETQQEVPTREKANETQPQRIPARENAAEVQSTAAENTVRPYPVWVSYSVLSGALLALGGAVYFDRQSSADLEEYDQRIKEVCPRGCERSTVDSEILDLRERGKNRQNLARVGYALVGVLAASGGLLLYLNRPRTGRPVVEKKATLIPHFSESAVGVSARIRF